MKYAVITVAGMSERFNEGYENPILKCIYYEKDKKKTLLYSILKKCNGMDKVIIVGGYQYENLVDYVNKFREDFIFDIELVFNPEYKKYGSGYSLYCGLQVCYEREDCSEIIFIEGDLSFDEETFDKIKASSKDIITINNDPICSNKAVALYINQEDKIRYIYNTEHGLFNISEPFLEIHNSGQIWKISSIDIFKETYQKMDKREWEGTNLVFLEKFYNKLEFKEIQLLKFGSWTNCNTRKDLMLCKNI